MAIAVGDDIRARATASRFATETAPNLRAMAKLIDAESLRHSGKTAQAIVEFGEARKLADLAIGHVLLAKALLDAKRYAEAYGELQTCLQRRGEIAIDPYDAPGYHRLPEITFELARAQEGLGNPAAAASYNAFLAALHEPDTDFVLARTARARLAAMK